MVQDVVYWPPTRPGCQNRKCTCVNNRCIRSRNIRILTVDGLNECEIVTLAGRRVGVKLLYNPGEDRKSVSRWSDQLEIRCGRENQHPAEGALRTPDWAVEVQISWREDAGMRNMSQRGWALRPPIEQRRRTGKKRCYGHQSGVNTLEFCSVCNSLSQ